MLYAFYASTNGKIFLLHEGFPLYIFDGIHVYKIVINKLKNITMSFNRDYLKNRFYIEPGLTGWVFRLEGSDKIIRKERYKMLLLSFAESYCDNVSELRICDSNGMLEDIVEIGKNKLIQNQN